MKWGKETAPSHQSEGMREGATNEMVSFSLNDAKRFCVRCSPRDVALPTNLQFSLGVARSLAVHFVCSFVLICCFLFFLFVCLIHFFDVRGSLL